MGGQLGNEGVAGSGSFTLIEEVEQAEPDEPVDRVFFIDISGGMELRLADLFDEPILEIRGKVSLEIGNRTMRDSNNCLVYPDGTATNLVDGCQIPVVVGTDPLKRFRFGLTASGTIKVIKLGNIASGAASFVLEKGDSLADIEFWGVVAFQTNLQFLEQYGIYAQGSALLTVNATDRLQREMISLEGIPGGVVFVLPTDTYASTLASLPTDTFNPVDLPAAWAAVFQDFPDDLDGDGTIASDPEQALTLATGQFFKLEPLAQFTPENATIEGIVAGKKWKIKNGDGRQFFVEKTMMLLPDQSEAEVLVVRGEVRTYDLEPLSFSVQVVGGLTIKNTETGDDIVHIDGGFFIKIKPDRFEFFVTAGGSIVPLGLSGRITGLFIASAELAGPCPGPSCVIPGVAGLLRLEITAGTGPDQPTTGVSDIARHLPVRGPRAGDAQHDAQGADVQRARGVPRRPPGRLPDADHRLQVAPVARRHERGQPARQRRHLRRSADRGLDHPLRRHHPERVHQLPGQRRPDRRRDRADLRAR